MGLADPMRANTWRVRRDFETVLRSMQRASDRQRTLAAHGAVLSDPRLPLQVTPMAALTELEGRVLGHGEEEMSGRPYVLIEGTDAKVHYIYYDETIHAARHRGLMAANSFVRFERHVDERGRTRLSVQDLGDAEKLLTNKAYIRKRAQQLVQSGIVTHDTEWAGWLGRYGTAIAAEAPVLRSALRRAGHDSLDTKRRR
jgi:Protein of unknown function (DUF3363)